jgi:tRNA (guanine-N7-)-methyltransferase
MRTRSLSLANARPASAWQGQLPIVDLGATRVPLESEQLFGSERPLEIEIGGGKGQFMLAWAGAHPEIGLLVVERARKYCELAAARAFRHGLGNVKFLATTAEDLLFRCLRPNSVVAFHVYYPDPWPKKRHHKRRFFRSENVARLVEVLEPGGLLRAKTDHTTYAPAIAEVLAAEPHLEPVPLEEAFADVPPTNYESKYANDDRAVHRFAFRRAC